MKTVYIAISADILHHGHINLIKKASEYGDLIVGVLTDEAIATYKRLPVIDFEQRSFIISNIQGVKKVVAQESLDYTDNLRKFKPDYVFHGDDWKEGVQSKVRQNVIETLKEDAVWKKALSKRQRFSRKWVIDLYSFPSFRD